MQEFASPEGYSAGGLHDQNHPWADDRYVLIVTFKLSDGRLVGGCYREKGLAAFDGVMHRASGWALIC